MLRLSTKTCQAVFAKPLSASHALRIATGRGVLAPLQHRGLTSRATVDNTGPNDILEFWFGEGRWGTPLMGQADLFNDRLSLWWGINPETFQPVSPEEQAEIDAGCRAYEDLVRAAGARSLPDQWSTNNGRYAEMLLCDQISRGAFRATPDAFAFDERAIELRRGLYRDGVHLTDYDVAHWTFFMTPGEHSEDIQDHRDNDEILRYIASKHGTDSHMVQMLKNACDEHSEIIERFGRYPHRNALHGRKNTPEEQAWLDDYDNLPGFAKSQLPPKSNH